MVVLQMYMNDFTEQARHEGSKEKTSKTNQGITVSQALFVIKEQIITRSAVLMRVRQLSNMVAYRLAHDFRRRHFAGSVNAAEPEAKLALLNRLVDDESISAFVSTLELQQLAKQQGIPLVVFLSPHEAELYSQEFDGIQHRFQDFCRQNGLRCVDVLSELRRLSPDEQRNLFLDGVHLSEFGHARLAKILQDKLMLDGKLQQLCR